MSIGIAITTKDRPDVLKFTIDQHLKNLCPAKYLIVDDNSTDNVFNESYSRLLGEYHYNNVRLGVAKSKNVCIKKLDVDHLFLFDDDCFPIKQGWWKPWVDSGVDFMTFGCEDTISIEKRENGLTYWNGHHGCALYLTRKCIEVIGGFDPDFGLYGFEHSELAQRVLKSGIIDHNYISPNDTGMWSFDAQGSFGDFKWCGKHCMAENEVQSAIIINGEILGQVMKKTGIYRNIHLP